MGKYQNVLSMFRKTNKQTNKQKAERWAGQGCRTYLLDGKMSTVIPISG